LSEREFEVFLQLANDETAADIAKTLSLSFKIVSTYRHAPHGEDESLDLTYDAPRNKLID
jgi:hypothetical protein